MPTNAKRSVLINPILARDIHETHRAATPLELFYDLIYVVAIAFLAAELHHALTEWHHVGHAIFMYFFIFWCIWWPWNSYTWFASGYDTDDVQFRLASFAQMIGVIVIAVGIKPAFQSSNFVIMMVGYVTMRIPAILMWLKVARDDRESRPTALRYAIGVFLVQCAWTFSILFYNHWHVFGVLLILELLVPWFAERSVNKGRNTKYHSEHIEERFGLLTIIVLGESVLASINAFDRVFATLTSELGLTVAGALMMLFSMWWLYFDDKVDKRLHNESIAFLWAYGHYFIFASAAAVGALISVCVDAITHHGHITLDHAVLGLSIALAAYLVAVWLCHDFILRKKGLAGVELLLLAVMVIGIAWLTSSVLLIGLAFVALNAVRLLRRHRAYKAAL